MRMWVRDWGCGCEYPLTPAGTSYPDSSVGLCSCLVLAGVTGHSLGTREFVLVI